MLPLGKESGLYKVAVKVRPELAEMSGLPLVGNLIDFVQFLYALPFAIVAVSWLLLSTDSDVVRQHWLLLLLLVLLHALFDYFGFQLQLEVLPGVFASASGTLDSLLIWSAALLFGPTALWLVVLVEFGRFIIQWRQDKSGELRWFNVRALLDGVGYETLPGLVGLWVYGRLGGVLPFPGFDSGSLWPTVGGTAVAFLSLIIATLPLSRFIARSTQQLGEESYISGPAMFRFLLISASLPGLVYPFAILVAGLYAGLGVAAYLFFMAGAFLASVLAHRLSQAAASSQQRSRELAALEQLGRAIIVAPPDAVNLPDLLAAHAPKMLPLHVRAYIWLLPDAILYENPAKDAPFYITQANEALANGAPYRRIEPVPPPPTEANGAAREGVIVPIQADDAVILGGIYVIVRIGQAAVMAFLPALQSLAAQIASALRRAEVYEQTLASEKMAQELAVAGRIQASFLPRAVPEIPGWDIAAMLEPARQTSGDFYDFVELGDGRFGILVADVADKGTGAALYMALSRTLIRTYAMQYPDAPEEALRRANERILADTGSDQFVTVFYGVVDPARGTLTYANAGHNPAFLVRGAGGAPQTAAQKLGQTGIPLGMFEGMAWQQRSLMIEPGDVLALYTDGVTEAQNAAQAEFGEARLLAALKGKTTGEMVTAVLGAIHAFVGDAPQFDDVTLVIVVRR